MPEPKETKAFEWYKTMLELGNYEAEFGTKRFHEALTHHLGITAGIVALAWYAILQERQLILVLTGLVALLGAMNAWLWRKELASSRWWTKRWRHSAALIEGQKAFKEEVQCNVHGLSMSDKDRDKRREEENARRRTLAWRLLYQMTKSLAEKAGATVTLNSEPASKLAASDTSQDESKAKQDAPVDPERTFWSDPGLGIYARRWQQTAISFVVLYVFWIFLLLYGWLGDPSVLAKKVEHADSATNFVFLVQATNIPLSITHLNPSQSTNVLILITPTNEPPVIKIAPK